ncbi:MAG: DUF4157 domain-containing protein [Bacteroidales bacterium]|nr:DUF4157 domain-containing protein [Bacteroidales bacterium]
MKKYTEKTNYQHSFIPEVKPGNQTGSTLQLMDKRSSTIFQRKLLDTMHGSVGNNNILKQRENKTGLPLHLKSGMEKLSGYSMDDVRVHYNSNKPAQLRAHAFAQGSHIHLGPGQEKHLSHELGHVVQQKRNKVTPTFQLKGKVNINDDPKLEKDADRLGDKAIQLGSSLESSSGLKTSQPSSNQNIIQGYFFNGPYQYSSDNELFKDLKNYVKEFSMKLFLTFQPLKKLATMLFSEYGNNQDRHMEIGMVEKVLKQWCKENKEYAFTFGDINEIVHQLRNVLPYDINTPGWFEKRIIRDMRIPEQTRKAYIAAWNDKRNNRETYKTVKSAVKDMRLNLMANNRKEAHAYLRTGKYMKEQKTAFNYIPRNMDVNEEIILNNVKRAVLNMRKDLMVSFYYNVENEEEIFGDIAPHSRDRNVTGKEDKSVYSPGILSLTERKKSGSQVDSKSQLKDEENKTDMFVYGWIEHKDGEYNYNTRFNLPAHTGGDTTAVANYETAYEGGRRAHRPIDKVAVDGALVMLGDLTTDTLALDKSRLDLGTSDANNLIIGLDLKIQNGDTQKYAHDILEALMNRMIIRLRKVKKTIRKPIVEKLENILKNDAKGNAELWSYITKNIMRPQFMVPKYIMHAMKGLAFDAITKEQAGKAAYNRMTTNTKEQNLEDEYQKEMEISAFPLTSFGHETNYYSDYNKFDDDESEDGNLENILGLDN